VIQRNPDDLMLKVLDALNESQARWYVAREVLARGRGGLKAMYELTGMSRPTIIKGIRELQGQKGLPRERVRQPGGGRKRLEESDPGLQTALERIMEENTAGDPMSWLRFELFSGY
jgi:hypothetical protein